MKYVKNRGLLRLLPYLLSMLLGVCLWVIGAQLMMEKISLLYTLYTVGGAILFAISAVFTIGKLLDFAYLEQADKNNTSGIEDGELTSHDIDNQKHQRKYDRKIITLSITGIIAGISLCFLPVILWNNETSSFTAPCIYAGLGLIFVSVIYYGMHMLKQRHPDHYRKQEIESKDERNIIIRDKAGAKTLMYLWLMLGISWFAYKLFNIDYDYVDWILNISVISVFIHVIHLHYYERKI